MSAATNNRLAQYRKAKILSLFGKSTLTKKQLKAKMIGSGDSNLEIHEDTTRKYLTELVKEGKLYYKSMLHGTKLFQRNPFQENYINPTIQIETPFDKSLSLMMGYATILPSTKGKRYTEHDAVPALPAQTHNSKISIQCSMNTVFYGA